MGNSAGGVFLPNEPPPSTGQVLTSPTIVGGAAGSTFTAPVISGAATVASGAVITTPTIYVTTSTGTITGATGGAGLALTAVTPQYVAATGTSGAGIDLPGGATGAVGALYHIVNMTTGVMNIYAVGGTINGTTGTTAFAVTATGNRTVDVFSVAAGVWIARGNT